MNETAVPRTDAHALHALLSVVAQSPAPGGLHSPWAEVLGADPATAEFAKRHGEVVALFNRSVEQIAMLPQASRANDEQWVGTWWKAVVAPDMKWDSQLTGKIIEDVHLSLLHTLGDVIQANLGGSSASPGGAYVTELQAAVEAWVAELVDDPAILPNSGLRLSLIESLNHVLWLIEHREMFGDAPIAQAAQQAVGAAAIASAQVPADKRPSWRKKAVALAGTIAIFNGIVTGTQTAIESAESAVTAAIEVGEDIVDQFQGD